MHPTKRMVSRIERNLDSTLNSAYPSTLTSRFPCQPNLITEQLAVSATRLKPLPTADRDDVRMFRTHASPGQLYVCIRYSKAPGTNGITDQCTTVIVPDKFT